MEITEGCQSLIMATAMVCMAEDSTIRVEKTKKFKGQGISELLSMDIEITAINTTRTPLERVTVRQELKSRNEGGGLGVGVTSMEG